MVLGAESHARSADVLEVWCDGKRSHLTVRAFDGYSAYTGVLPLEDRGRYTIGPQPDTIDFPELFEKLQHIPDERIYPAFREGMIQFSGALEQPAAEAEYFLKAPVVDGNPSDDRIAQDLLTEAITNEMFLEQPHRHLVQYKGCLVNNGRIVRLAFKRYSESLYDRMLKDSADFSPEDRKKCMDAIESAAAHLHKLGYAHNDISPSNIMFDSSNAPILIDLDCCALIGSKLDKGGHVTGWRGPLFDHGQKFDLSSEQCDLLAINFIREWLEVLT